MRIWGMLVATIVAAFGAMPDAAAEGDVGKGRALADKYCARCHVIDARNRYGGIESTPSFPLLARRKDYFERFQTFYRRRPHPVYVRVPDVPPPTKLPAYASVFEVTPEDVENLLAFVETLRSAAR